MNMHSKRISNLSFWLFNSIIGYALLASQDELRQAWPPTLLNFSGGFLLLDLLSYGLHRAFHAVPDLWRLHALHHSDPQVDITTAVRHHPAEALLSATIYWGAIFVLGIPAEVTMTYSGIVFAAAVLTHNGAAFPAWMERVFGMVIITPAMHLVHHSLDPAAANSNFGAVLSIWDRLFGTLLVQEPKQDLRCGVAGLDPQDACRPLPMLLTPMRVDNDHYFPATYPLADGREIQVSADVRPNVVRLRAMLVENGIVKTAHRRDYRGAHHQTALNIDRFTREFEELSGISLWHPLFSF